MKSLTKNQLTPEESGERARLEAIVENGFKTFAQVGQALIEISDKRLYRNTHSTFKDYVSDKWNMTAARAYQLCDAAEVVKSLPPEMSTIVDNEAKTRVLAKVPKKRRAKVLKMAKAHADAHGKPVTAREIQHAAEAVANKPKSTPAPEPATQSPPDDDEGQALQGFKIDLASCVAAIPENAQLSPYIALLREEARGLEKRALQSEPKPNGWFKAYTNSK